MPRNFFRSIQVSCITALFVVQATANAAEPTVVAGQSLGRVRLGFTRSQVHKALGKPDKNFKLKGGLSDDLWRAKTVSRDNNGRAIRHKVEVIYKSGKVIQIEATSPVFVTAKGLSTKSPLRTLNSALKPKRYFTYGYGDDYVKYYLDQVQAGIAFESSPHQDNWFWDTPAETIIVHRKGVPVIPDQGGEFESSKAYVPSEDATE